MSRQFARYAPTCFARIWPTWRLPHFAAGTFGGFRLQALNRLADVDHEAAMRPAADWLDFVFGRHVERDLAAFQGAHGNRDLDRHAEQGRRKMFDGDVGADRILAGITVL